ADDGSGSQHGDRGACGGSGIAAGEDGGGDAADGGDAFGEQGGGDALSTFLWRAAEAGHAAGLCAGASGDHGGGDPDGGVCADGEFAAELGFEVHGGGRGFADEVRYVGVP